MRRAPFPVLPLVCAALCAFAAAALAASPLDRSAFLALNGAAARLLPDAVPAGLTLLGNGLVAVMLLAPLLGRAPQAIVAGLFAAPCAGLLSALGKRVAEVPRPAAVFDAAQIHVTGMLLRGHNSLPSGHSITAFLVATVALLGAEDLRTRPWAIAGVVALACLVAGSRVMVGAHWPSDTLAGAALGIIAGCAGHWAARRWPLERARHGPKALALAVLGCAVALCWADTGYPEGAAVQYVAALAGAACALRALVRPS